MFMHTVTYMGGRGQTPGGGGGRVNEPGGMEDIYILGSEGVFAKNGLKLAG